MKPHCTIHFRTGLPEGKFPHWETFIHRKGQAPESVNSEVDAAMQKAGKRFWAGTEYPAKGGKWSEDEKKAGLDRVLRLILQDDLPEFPQALISELRQISGIEKVEGGTIARTQLPPSISMSMSRTTGDWAHRAIGIARAHEITRGHGDIVVAVLDTGIDLKHPELAGRLVPGYDFVDILSGAEEFFGDKDAPDDDPDDQLVGHGTHVAGIIAAAGQSMAVGVAPHCKIMPVRVLGAVKGGNGYVGAGLVDNINNGIKWAVDHGAHIINMSLGIRRDGGGLPHQEAIRYAEQKGVTVVAASGNDGTAELYYPGALDSVIAVGAIGREGNITNFTTYGKVTCAAPGEEIYSAHVQNGYAFASGTSQAAPFVAGTAALLYAYAKQRGRTIGPDHIRYILKQTSDKSGTLNRSRKEGYGIINIPDALRLLEYKLEYTGKF